MPSQAKVNLEIYDVTDWDTNNYNTNNVHKNIPQEVKATRQ